jgi:hypothetical protein
VSSYFSLFLLSFFLSLSLSFFLSLKSHVVWSVLVCVPCWFRSGQVKVSCPLLCCWHLRNIPSLLTRTNPGCKEVCSLCAKQDLTDLQDLKIPSLLVFPEWLVWLC